MTTVQWRLDRRLNSAATDRNAMGAILLDGHREDNGDKQVVTGARHESIECAEDVRHRVGELGVYHTKLFLTPNQCCLSW